MFTIQRIYVSFTKITFSPGPGRLECTIVNHLKLFTMKKTLFITLFGILLTTEISAQGFLWAKQSVGEVGVGSAEGKDVACDNEGNTYVVGNFNNTVYFGDSIVSGNFGIMYVVKYDILSLGRAYANFSNGLFCPEISLGC